ncbi:MAG: AraC family ligand binding domain-containing protein [Lachnotalea sp.]
MQKVVYEESMDGITIERIARDYEFTMPSKHTHDEFEIYYLVEGERYYFIDTKTYHVKKGSLVFINKNQIHKTGQYGNSYHERVVIEFSLEPFSSFLSSTGELSLTEFFKKPELILELNLHDLKHILSLLDHIALEIRTCDPGYQMMTMSNLARLLFFALRVWHNNTLVSNTVSLSTSATHQKVSEVASYIASNLLKSRRHLSFHKCLLLFIRLVSEVYSLNLHSKQH